MPIIEILDIETLILDEKRTGGLDGTTIMKHSVNISNHRSKICLCLHCNVSNSFLYVNGEKMQQFKANNSEIKRNSLCLRNISKDFTVDSLKKNWLKEYVYISLSAVIPVMLYWRNSQVFDEKTQHCLNAKIDLNKCLLFW